MSFLPTRPVLALLAPLVCVGLLLGMARQQGQYLQPEAFDGYHARIAATVRNLPLGVGRWVGRPEEIPASAQKLLKPNAIRAIRFADTGADYLWNPREVSYVVVQCRRPGDMVGHYPPICYPSLGWEAVSTAARTVTAGGRRLPVTEYEFVKRDQDREYRKIVYNFMVVAETGVSRDRSGIEAAAEDYQQRYYGAAQFQLVFPDRLCRTEDRAGRDRVFDVLMAPSLPLIDLIAGGKLVAAPPGAAPADDDAGVLAELGQTVGRVVRVIGRARQG